MNSSLPVSAPIESVLALPSPPQPSAFISYYNRGEVTLRMGGQSQSPGGFSAGDQSSAHAFEIQKQSDKALAQLLVNAGVAAAADVGTAAEIARINARPLLEICQIFFLLTPQLCMYLEVLTHCLTSGSLSMERAVKAARQAYLDCGISMTSR